MKFIANAKGYYNDKLIQPGEEFEAPEDFPGSWAVKAKEYEPASEKSDEEKAADALEGLQGKKKAEKKKAKKKVAKKAAKKKG